MFPIYESIPLVDILFGLTLLGVAFYNWKNKRKRAAIAAALAALTLFTLVGNWAFDWWDAEYRKREAICYLEKKAGQTPSAFCIEKEIK